MSTVSGTVKVEWETSEADLDIDDYEDVSGERLLSLCDAIEGALLLVLGDLGEQTVTRFRRNDMRVRIACREQTMDVEVTGGRVVGTLGDLRDKGKAKA